MASIALGTSRFVFVWLVGELTEWNPATAILGIVIGLLPYCSRRGRSLADRMSANSASAIRSVNGAVHHLGRPFARRFDDRPSGDGLRPRDGNRTSNAHALLQALVPRVVDDSVLLQAVALQNLGMTGSSVGGIFLGGAVIQAFGLEAGLWLLTAASIAGVIFHQRTPIPRHEARRWQGQSEVLLRSLSAQSLFVRFSR